MLKIFLVRPGSTDFDEQGRIKGTLDVPLNDHGNEQVARTIAELSGQAIEAIYCGPCQSCQQTARSLAEPRELRVKQLDALKNLDHGLWHGKLIEDVKLHQPKVYCQWQEHPETVCPPQGETVITARQRLAAALEKLWKKHKDGTIAIVAPEPLASMLRSVLNHSDLGDLWKVECDFGGWETIEMDSDSQVSLGSQAAPISTAPSDGTGGNGSAEG